MPMYFASFFFFSMTACGGGDIQHHRSSSPHAAPPSSHLRTITKIPISPASTCTTRTVLFAYLPRSTVGILVVDLRCVVVVVFPFIGSTVCSGDAGVMWRYGLVTTGDMVLVLPRRLRGASGVQCPVSLLSIIVSVCTQGVWDDTLGC